ncbi:hypothetical protein [Streptococcus cristatus]|uniref:hypothetical protein n=1 Tax=Streptococcus cristatus TaxID=45634 RepID=UPI0005EF98FC|nr:hypothetical protein [Streptococcus cristatus]KJQ59913.1 hypothetical protein TW70_00893 [Streptococcus cristatus]QIP49944.1 hypothetical protein HBA50_08205 [Streptococcus cristatus ATCC 51100]
MDKLAIFQILGEFLNSQFISSMLGALLGAGVAVYIAKLQNKQQLKQLKYEHKLQREFFEKQEENERERIFLQFTIERAERSYQILNELKKAEAMFRDEGIWFIENFSEELDFKTEFVKFYYKHLIPKYYHYIDLRDELLLSIVIQDDVKLSQLKTEVNDEIELFNSSFENISKVIDFVEYTKITDEFLAKTKLIEKCDKLKIHLTKYIMDSTFRLVSPEKMAEKILNQTKGDLNIRFKVVRKENMKGATED